MNGPLSGIQAWLIQRLSAVYLLGFSLYLLFHFIFFPPSDHGAWLAWLNTPLVATAWSLFFVALLIHAWVGIRDVILDYVHSLALRLLLLSAVGMALIGAGLWLLRILFGGVA
jgi:succinate dehydrogenase / fumarate reductase, membrane anchor subunit